LALFDTMKYIGSDVGTVGFGACMGMSGFMLAMGKKVPCTCCHADSARSLSCTAMSVSLISSGAESLVLFTSITIYFPVPM